jgi:hypothetical protein
MEQLQLEKWQKVSNGYTRGKTVITFGRDGLVGMQGII